MSICLLIQCKVNTKYAIYSSPTTKRIKLILEEAEDEGGKGSQPPARISIFLNGDFAEEFNEVDVLVCVEWSGKVFVEFEES